MNFLRNSLPLVVLTLAATPVFSAVTVTSPASGATVSSPVTYVATATAPACAKGVAAMGVYVNNQLAYKVNGASLNTTLVLAAGTYATVVQEWDNCGSATTTSIPITVSTAQAPPAAAGVSVSAPLAGSTVTSPVTIAASATAPACAKGIAAVGVYINNVLQYKMNGASMNTAIPLAAGAQTAVVQEWDNCGSYAKTSVAFKVAAAAPTNTTVALTATPATITAGASSVLNVTVTNANSVAITGTDGSSYSVSAAGGSQTVAPSATTTYTATATGATGSVTATAAVTVTASSTSSPSLTGVLEWKGNSKSFGQYNQESTLNLTNVNTTQFGKVRQVQTDGQILAQPVFVRAVNMGTTLGTHDLLIVATEHDSVFAYDGATTSATPLWKRSFLNATTGITTQADNHGGRSTFGGEIGITGTPVVDPATGILYVVAATTQNSIITDTLHAIDIRTGNEVSNIVITGTYAGTGETSVNGQIPFMASQQNQRPGLVLNHGVLYVAFGSFSDFAPYHGWLFAYDPASLKQLATFNTTPTYRADYDHGSGAAFWNGGAAPSFEDDGTFFIVAGDGSTDAENGGEDYGDSVLHMQYSNGRFSVLDFFTPFNRDCIDASDIEMGSGGFALLPEAEIGNGRHLGVAMTKEGRLYLLDRSSLGHFDATADKSVQMVMVGDHQCDATTTGAAADGPVWNRLYGDASYWNGNLYLAASNQPIKQFAITGAAINPVPVAVGTDNTYYRGGNTVVSSYGNTNGIVWEYQKTSDGNAMLHAFDATNVSHELWNSSMNKTRDGLLTGGEGFQVPVIVDGKVFAPSGSYLVMFKLLAK